MVKGEKCIVRSERAGVFYGTYDSLIQIGSVHILRLTNARCLWYWSGAATLLELATNGVKYPDECKFTVYIDSIELLGVCEILPVTKQAQKIIEGVKEWKAE